MAPEKKWYAVYTRPKCEKKVAELLLRNNIENYCPMNKSIRQWADRKKTIYQPLFSSYVFVRCDISGHLAIKQTSGVLNFVHWLGQIAVIKNEEINAIKEFVQQHQDVRLERIQVSISDKVRIVDGPLVCLEGKVTEVNSHSVKVSLPSLGCVLAAEVAKGSIEIISVRSDQSPKILSQARRVS